MGAGASRAAGPCLPSRRHTTSVKYLRTRHRICRRRSSGADTLARVTNGLGRVLVVDDDEVIRQLIAVNLTLEGFDVATAVDGRDCLEKALAISPDIVVLDLSMPRVDGLQT